MVEIISYREALCRAQADEMSSDPNVFIFGLDVDDHKSIFGSTKGLLDKFGPSRVFGTPLSEDAMTGVALGAALSGMRPIHIHIRVDFMMLSMNQISNMIAPLRYLSGGKLNVPLVIRAVIGRGWGQGAQHSKTLHNYFAHLPGLKVVMPTTPQDAYSLLRTSVRDDNPVVFIEHRWLYDVVDKVDFDVQIPIGKANTLRKGKDLTVVTTTWMGIEALKAAEVLAKRGVDIEVIDVRSIAPLDINTLIESVRKTKKCIIADYDWTFAGFSAEVAAQLSEHCFSDLQKPIHRLGFAHTPCPTARPLEVEFYPAAPQIIRQVEKILNISASDLSNESFYSYEQKFKGPF